MSSHPERSGNTPGLRILALANAHALAHVSRLLEIAKVLRARGHEVVFAGHGKYLPVAAADGFATRELPYIPVERVVRAVRSQRLWELYQEDELEGFIAAERALYDALVPDCVLIDNRPSARTSAELAGIPSVAVLNVHMSNYRVLPFFSWVQAAGGRGWLEPLDRWQNALECRLYDRLVMGGMNRLRRRLGLKPLYAYEHEEGQLALLADLPEFNPARALPPHVRYIGPLTWHNALPPPHCLERLDPARPVAYFSLGSEGLAELVQALGALTDEGVQVVVAAGAAEAERLQPPPGVWLERFVNTERLLPQCDLVVCHGGNGTLYQALAHGLPCVVVATHAEQHYGGKRIVQLGLGRATTLPRLRRRGLRWLTDNVRVLLSDPAYRQRALAFRARFAGWEGAQAGAEAVEVLARRH